MFKNGRKTHPYDEAAHSDKQKISWVLWDEVTRLKKDGGLGIRDLKAFNVALLAKQGWCTLQNPSSILAKLYQAKYFPSGSLLQAKSGNSFCHAWRSICRGIGILRKGIDWRIGCGNNVHVWTDNWVPGNEYRLPKPRHAMGKHSDKVSDLIDMRTGAWKLHKLRNLFTDEDVSIILRIQITRNASNNFPTWKFTKHGTYTVKSGYHVLKEEEASSWKASSSRQGETKPLYSKIWQLPSQPKLRHFWWKVVHDALHVYENLMRRKMKSEATCDVCGEKSESIKHMLFTCRVAREIWELSHPNIRIEEEDGNQSIADIINHALLMKPESINLFVITGWHIWKSRNLLVYQGKRSMILDIINKSYIDHSLWQVATQEEAEERQKNANKKDHRAGDIIRGKVCCFTDASWILKDAKAGYGWCLYDRYHQISMIGYSSLAPLSSPLEAESVSLLEALKQLQMLGHLEVTMASDSKQLIALLQDARQHYTSLFAKWRNHEIAPVLHEIGNILLQLPNFRLFFISRDLNVVADKLARMARLKRSNGLH